MELGDSLRVLGETAEAMVHLNLAIGAESHFTYGFTHSELRRKGRMTARQRKV